ncbi:DNA-binding storekeeper protein-related transcriptional regulator [Raphanus sativus]|uniref:Probable transcription factor At1g11510 n=1 Tax=Raphanus sativus TaxID=3726 RepID=A0A9W3DGI6_RAPSA|nr:probable transcription factor At1g11510 [Raphanus sativus]KAJ4915455.1 DNA-binding storekeeper protein-related transcriptional regulator [Raphanus sativus]
MSKKRFNPLEDPPNASSSDEDNDEMEAAGNSSSEEETDDDESSLKKPESAPPEKKHQPSDSGSGSGSGSDEETDSDSLTERKSSSAVKSLTTGTKDSAVAVAAKKNHDSDKKVKPLTKCSTKKRSLSETEGAAAEAKKAKTGTGTGEESAKKSYFQRVWSEEDEIAALQGLIDYRDETGASPYDDTNAFYLSVKKSISFDVSKTQLLKKLWGLKTKYENNLGKEKNGEEVSFSKPHDRKAFDLSKLFWGGDGVALDSAVKSNGKKSKKSSKSKKVEEEPEKVALDSANGKSKKSSKSKVEPEKKELVSSSSPNGKSCEDEVVTTNKGEASPLGVVAEVDDAFEKSVLVKAVARFGVDDITAQQGWSRLALEDKKRFEEEWKVLQLRELELYSQKSGFIHEVVTKMAESFQPNP